MEVIIISQEVLAAFTHPAVDLIAGRLFELPPPDSHQHQLDLFSESNMPHRHGLSGDTFGED